MVQSISMILRLALLAIVLSTSALDCVAADALTMSILTNASVDGAKAINIDDAFQVVLKNNTEKEIKIWNPASEQDCYDLTFESMSSKTGETLVTRKNQLEGVAKSKAIPDINEPTKNQIVIASGKEITIPIYMLGFSGGELTWLGVPEPNNGVVCRVKAKYQVVSSEGSDRSMWNGQIESDPIDLRVISKRIDTPHEYLANNFPKAALAVMEHDRSWINRTNKESETPLHIASRHKHLEAIKWLLDNGADVNAIAYNGFTPLHLTSDPEVVELILKYSPNLSIRCHIFGQTPLQEAIGEIEYAESDQERRNWETIVDLYFAAGAEYDIVTAIHRNDLARVKSIQEELPEELSYEDDPLRCAASLGRLEICKYLIEERDMDVDQFERGNGYPIIKDALAHPDIVRLLIASGANLRETITWTGGRTGLWPIGDNATALHYAADYGVPETVKLLIDAGVDIFATTRESFSSAQSEQTALDVACMFGKADNAEAIINHSKFGEAEPELRQKTLDRCLVTGCHANSPFGNPGLPKTRKILLDKGANPNATDKEGRTAIELCAREVRPENGDVNVGPREAIAILRERGCKLDLYSAVAIGDEAAVARILSTNPQAANSREFDGYPALHKAVSMDYKTIVGLLLDAGADINIKSESKTTGGKGETALHCAAFWGRGEIAQFLLARGADVNARSESGSTPLHDAARMGNVQMTTLLLNNGAEIDAKDNKGETPLDWCKQRRSSSANEIVKLLGGHQD